MPAGETCFEPFAIWELPMPNCNGFSELTQTDFKKINPNCKCKLDTFW